jgi:DNA-binding CsgD family transcriptional regulator
MKGLPYKLAASELGISLSTFRHYIERSFEKLGARTSLEAIRNLQLMERGQKPSKKTYRRISVLC